MKKKQAIFVILTGAVIGIISAVLVKLGNPGNMGFCIACFLRDTAGALGFHKAAVVQYARPEIIGLILGAFIMAVCGKEFKVRGGSSPVTRFVLGVCVMIGALMFLGCPLRMVLRIAGGDLNAVVGLVGFVAGILIGVFFLKKGFTLRKSQPQWALEGALMPVMAVVVLFLLICVPSVLIFSESGPGSMRAPIIVALAAGLIVGALAQRARICMVGGIRDAFLFKDFTLLYGFVAIIVFCLLGNLIFGKFNLGFAEQAIAHTDGLWNFLGMVVVGLGSVMLGGCPLRQLILAGGGSSDGAISVLGMIVGAAICHNFGLASSAAGPTAAGKIATIACLVVCCAIGFFNRQKSEG